jgi:glycolate oxidase FAD binding subunit
VSPPVETPPDREALCGLLAAASREGRAVRVVGGGTASRRGVPGPAPDVVVSTARLDRLIAHEPADLTVTVEAGHPLGPLQDALAARGQTWAQAPARPGATVGGVLSTAEAGDRRLLYGPVRDAVLQVVVVTGDGRLVTAGGRTVKGVAGYDIPRLIVGALGTLGVIVEVTVKLWPRPAGAAWFAATGDTERLALLGERLRRVLHRPGALLLTPGRLDCELIGPSADLVAPEGMAPSGGPAPAPAWDATMEAGVPPTALPELTSALHARGLPFRAALGVGTCRVGLAAPADVGFVRGLARALGGHAQVLDAPGAYRADPWGPPPPGLAIMRRLKAAFDPAGILNRGLFVGDAPGVAS